MAELVDAHVSGACSERSAGSSPVPGTKEILQVVLIERRCKISFFIPHFGHSLAIFSEKEKLAIFNADGKEHPFLTIFIAVFGICAEMERENIKFRLNSGKEKFIAEGGKVGRKEGYQKSDEKLQEEYAGVIKQLRKGYPIRMIAKNEGVGISTVQRMKKGFVDVA